MICAAEIYVKRAIQPTSGKVNLESFLYIILSSRDKRVLTTTTISDYFKSIVNLK